MIVENMLQLIGSNPLICLNMKNNNWKVYIKLEKFNPGQSMKDRMALNMIEQAELRGQLKKGGTIIESSSGNTATGLALVSAIKGYKFIAVVDHHTSKDKIKTIQAYGGEIVMVGNGNKENEVATSERKKKALELAKIIPNSYCPQQYDNPDNKTAYIKLAEELIGELNEIDELYASIGTGGSICGTSMGLKKCNSKCKINAVEPIGSIVFGGKGGPYYQSGTGTPPNASIASIIDFNLIDKNYYVSDQEAFNTCRYMATNYGILLGGSGGGVLYKALEEINNKTGSGTAVVLVCDGGEKYLDTIFNDSWLNERNLHSENVKNNLKNWLK